MDFSLWYSLQKSGILKKIYKKPGLNDEPKLFCYGTEINSEKVSTDGNLPEAISSGTSINERAAILKSVFESVERLSLAEFQFKDFIFGSYKEVYKLGATIHPRDFCYFSKTQLNKKSYSGFCFSDKCEFNWTKCKNFNTGKDVFLPSQTIFCPYKYKDNEKTIIFPITTGASASKNLYGALYGGFCEVIERDAYITNYLLKLKPSQIILKSVGSKKIVRLLENFIKYRLEIKSYVLVSDINIPTVLSLIIDQTGRGPAISIGLKTDLDLNNAIIGSIEEAYQIRSWIRVVMIEDRWEGDTYVSKNMLKRAYLWKNLSNLKNLDFILNSPNIAKISNYIPNKYIKMLPENKLEVIKKEFVKINANAYYKDVTTTRFKKMGLAVVKCVVPGLHPMFIDHDFPYLGGKRIKQLMKKYNVKSLNLYPHPFL